ncbi:hypothetical protein DAEQUDRAFT_730964 [Daedalea quercina L-15889]|uniref:Uncharacterized protein n=1 Tax=Daedalea quercina L-15889 TaxID=1314783 RepID=A0A165MK87_9APHY|nr:hypothetical protein DAEQUDRAFT_730964 [Daedalea quercina L-15889]
MKSGSLPLASTSGYASPLPHFGTIHAESRKIFNKVPASKIRHLSFDLSFVSLGIRTGYLFDAFAISGPGRGATLLIDLLASLRQV